MKLTSLIKIAKAQKDFQLTLMLDPEVPFEIYFNNIQVQDSNDQPLSTDIKSFSKGNKWSIDQHASENHTCVIS